MAESLIKTKWVECRWCKTKLSWDSREKKMREFGSWKSHTPWECPSNKNKTETEVIEKILQKHGILLEQILEKINLMLDEHTEPTSNV